GSFIPPSTSQTRAIAETCLPGSSRTARGPLRRSDSPHADDTDPSLGTVFRLHSSPGGRDLPRSGARQTGKGSGFGSSLRFSPPRDVESRDLRAKRAGLERTGLRRSVTGAQGGSRVLRASLLELSVGLAGGAFV